MNHDHSLRGAAASVARLSLGPLGWAILAFVALMVLYFGVLTLASGWAFTLSQFSQYWPYILALGAGFATQVGLYVRLRCNSFGSASHSTPRGSFTSAESCPTL